MRLSRTFRRYIRAYFGGHSPVCCTILGTRDYGFIVRRSDLVGEFFAFKHYDGSYRGRSLNVIGNE